MSPTKLNISTYYSDEVDEQIDDLGSVGSLVIDGCSRYHLFPLFDRHYHSGLLSVTSRSASTPHAVQLAIQVVK